MKWHPLRIAIILLILTMFTSSIVSSTFAKYTVSESSSDYARVAKWGITVFSRGNLYGTAYEETPANSITENDDGSVTVKSHNVSKVIGPGTKNIIGLEFGISGTAEVALKLDVTIKNQNVFLRNNEYFILHKIPDLVNAGNFEDIQNYYGDIYIEDDENFIKCDGYAGDKNYFSVFNEVELEQSYFPIVYEIEPIDEIHGFSATHRGIKGYSRDELEIGIYDDSLDIISHFLQFYTLDADESWPAMNLNKVYERTISKTFAAGTNLETINIFGIQTECMRHEKLTWSWDFQRGMPHTKLFNDADNILGRLSADKIYGPLDDDFVVIRNRTYSYDLNGRIVISIDDESDILIRPEEYIDYCLDTAFDIQMTISQIN